MLGKLYWGVHPVQQASEIWERLLDLVLCFDVNTSKAAVSDSGHRWLLLHNQVLPQGLVRGLLKVTP